MQMKNKYLRLTPDTLIIITAELPERITAQYTKNTQHEPIYDGYNI